MLVLPIADTEFLPSGVTVIKESKRKVHFEEALFTQEKQKFLC